MSDLEPIPASRRTIALVGLMGVGKSTVGRRLARRLHLPFADGDVEIEAAAGMTVSEIFARLGEPEFRAGEARVMRRLLDGERRVLATGGGAILNPDTRALMKQRATTVWMRADLEVVAQRVQRRDTRPSPRFATPFMPPRMSPWMSPAVPMQRLSKPSSRVSRHTGSRITRHEYDPVCLGRRVCPL